MLLRKSVTREGLDMLLSLDEVYDGRPKKGEWVDVRDGDVIVYYYQRHELTCKVMEIITYSSFLELDYLVPHVLPYVHSPEDGFYQGFFPARDEPVIALRIKVLHSMQNPM